MADKVKKAHGHIIQADWNQTDPLEMNYIHNKPENIATKDMLPKWVTLDNLNINGNPCNDGNGYFLLDNPLATLENGDVLEILGEFSSQFDSTDGVHTGTDYYWYVLGVCNGKIWKINDTCYISASLSTNQSMDTFVETATAHKQIVGGNYFATISNDAHWFFVGAPHLFRFTKAQ